MNNTINAKILIADDDRTLRMLLRLALEEDGYEVFEAKNGEQCLIEYNQFSPDMVLLDGMMPGMDGFACCKQLRTLSGGDRIPILMITVLDDQNSVDQAFAAGATDYITKPIHWAVLSRRVGRLLEASLALKQAENFNKILDKQQEWDNLLKVILEQKEPLKEIVSQIRIFWEMEAVVLSVEPKNLFINSITDETPLLPESFWKTVTREIFAQNLPCATEAFISQESLALLQQSQIQSFLLIPLYRNDSYQGFLAAYSQSAREWKTTELEKWKILSQVIHFLLCIT